MKLGVISDLHVDVNKAYPIAELLAQQATQQQLDILLLAGDISNDYTTTLAFLDRMAALCNIPCRFVPGNHDLWQQGDEYPDTAALYRLYAQHPACLAGRNVPLGGDWVVVGETGWYDYSFGGAAYTPQQFARRALGGRTWQDSLFTNWGQPDAQVHEAMLQSLTEKLKQTQGKKQIAVTHMVTAPQFTVPTERENWAYFNAFLGSSAYGQLYRQAGVRVSIMGHVHYRKQVTEGETTYLCSCLNYFSEWQSRDPAKEVAEALAVFELD